MNLKHNDLFATKHLHGNRSAGLELRQALHILIDIVDGLAINLLNDIAATDTGIMGRLASHHNISSQTGNRTGSHDIGHQSKGDLKLGMLHGLGAGHIDVIGRLGESCQTGYELLREVERLLHTVVIQRGRDHNRRGYN